MSTGHEETVNLLIPPRYCQYAGGECDQKLVPAEIGNIFFAYPNEPSNLSATIDSAVELLSKTNRKYNWLTWKNLPIPGQIIL